MRFRFEKIVDVSDFYGEIFCHKDFLEMFKNQHNFFLLPHCMNSATDLRHNTHFSFQRYSNAIQLQKSW